MNASFELLDGDTEILPGVSVITTPGHTEGHQSVVVRTGDGSADLLTGDAAYTPRQYRQPPGPDGGGLPPGQAADLAAWTGSLARMCALGADRVHFCHSTAVLHG
jgi:glyoxylase-like metal-dependent hydrolase (beta-lactamase superfamily II)